MPYKIKWKLGGETASAYSSKVLAKRILKSSKLRGSVVKRSLRNPPRSPLSGLKTVWVRNKASAFNKKDKGFIFHTRAISALSQAEKKRVVRR